ncbi:MAG: iron-containing alcohol dehydrogenase [Oscillospiraceae bacterium]|jgi:alcohol dehydrogenase YqhD (iron-dependent ADH family)|nr:iron-containing alcohol dehydrogenase [Oscillospiraceae bacterium]
MKDFEFWTPTKIVFGRDTENRAGALLRELDAKRAFIVYGGGSVVRSGLMSRVERSLAQAGIAYELFGGVRPNPYLEYAEEGAAKAIAFGADAVLAVGGGSAIDTAKGIAHKAANPGVSMWDMWTGAAAVKKSLPVGAILTIPAAGSEMSDSAVLTNRALGIKRGLSCAANRPAFAIMNPSLASTLPKEQLAYGICDILMHTLDRYFTHTKGNPLTDAFAEALLAVTMDAGNKVYADPNNYDAMGDLMWCSSVSHNGLTGLGAVVDFGPHRLGHELSAKYDVPHGASLTAVWRAWAEYVCPEEPARFARFARKVFGVSEPDDVEAARQGIQRQTVYFKRLDMPVKISETIAGKITSEDIAFMAEQATRDGPIANFKKLYFEDAKAIYIAADKG